MNNNEGNLLALFLWTMMMTARKQSRTAPMAPPTVNGGVEVVERGVVRPVWCYKPGSHTYNLNIVSHWFNKGVAEIGSIILLTVQEDWREVFWFYYVLCVIMTSHFNLPSLTFLLCSRRSSAPWALRCASALRLVRPLLALVWLLAPPACAPLTLHCASPLSGGSAPDILPAPAPVFPLGPCLPPPPPSGWSHRLPLPAPQPPLPPGLPPCLPPSGQPPSRVITSFLWSVTYALLLSFLLEVALDKSVC